MPSERLPAKDADGQSVYRAIAWEAHTLGRIYNGQGEPEQPSEVVKRLDALIERELRRSAQVADGPTVDCSACGFRFGAEHVRADETPEGVCPVCAEAARPSDDDADGHSIAKVRAAFDLLLKRAQGDTSGGGIMSIPARPDHDADLVLSSAIDELERLRAARPSAGPADAQQHEGEPLCE